MSKQQSARSKQRHRRTVIQEVLYRVIFEANTPAGKTFDVILLWAILASILSVVLESVPSIRAQYGMWIRRLEWGFTALFTVEYLLRLYCARRRWRYTRSFFGLVDLLTVLPGYLSLIFADSHYLLVIRSLRLLRVFRILKLVRFLNEASVLLQALKASRVKITVFLGGVLSLTVILGSLMYMIEGEANGFDSIPRGIYWAIVTLTTVGYGDISPHTALGQLIAACVMILGYGIIAVPTGIVTNELRDVQRVRLRALAGETPILYTPCTKCTATTHDKDANFCKLCGAKIVLTPEATLKRISPAPKADTP